MDHVIFAARPLVIAALHLTDPVVEPRPQSWLEDYVMANARVFAEAGVPALKLQDQTRATAAASAETVARMAALARLVRAEFPRLRLGVILQAHDAEAPLAVAAAAGACFVRLKVYVGAVLGAEGTRQGLAVAARAWRATHAPEVAILADVFDRTTVPLVPVPTGQAARWAEQHGADGLVLTGTDLADSLARIRQARRAGVTVPILLGGGVTAETAGEALAEADGVIVSTALMLPEPRGLVRWCRDRVRRLMDGAAAAAAAAGTRVA